MLMLNYILAVSEGDRSSWKPNLLAEPRHAPLWNLLDHEFRAESL